MWTSKSSDRPAAGQSPATTAREVALVSTPRPFIDKLTDALRNRSGECPNRTGMNPYSWRR